MDEKIFLARPQITKEELDSMFQYFRPTLLVSNCCGESGDGMVLSDGPTWREIGTCAKCREHCAYETGEDFDLAKRDREIRMMELTEAPKFEEEDCHLINPHLDRPEAI